MARNTRTITTARRPQVDTRYETSGTLAMDPELEARLKAHREARMQARKEERRRPRKERLERLETAEQLRAASIAAELTHTGAAPEGLEIEPRPQVRKPIFKREERAEDAGVQPADRVEAQAQPQKKPNPNRAYQRKQALVLACLGLAVALFVGSIVTMLLQKAHIATQTMQNDGYRKQVEAQQKLNDEMKATLGMGDDLATLRERAYTEFGMDAAKSDQIRTFALPAIPASEGVDVQMPSADNAAVDEELMPELR